MSDKKSTELKSRSRLSYKLAAWRRNKNVRLAVIIILLAVVVGLYFFWGKFRAALIAIFILLMVALGMEVSGNDWDLGKLIETGSFEESKVQQTENGTWLIGDECNEDNLNCANFKYQEEAQSQFELCGGVENDVNRLDGDGDGLVCESLPARP